MRRNTGLRRKIRTAFVLQVAAISFATVLGVYGAAMVLENVLIKHALQDEATHYWELLHSNPNAAPPDTYNMSAYLLRAGQGVETLPEKIREMDAGFYHRENSFSDDLIYVEQAEIGKLYLIFHQEQVGRLAFLFGFVPLIVVLLIIYITTWLTYRASRHALSPVIGLANVVRTWDPKKPDLEALDPDNLSSDLDGDVETLARALHGFATRIESFVERERNFTRDASHELRSPLTVLKVAADVLVEEEGQSPFARRAAIRIKRSVREMEALIESFLILAREGDTGLPEEDFVVNNVVRDEVERAELLLENTPVQLSLQEDHAFALHASPKVLSVLLGNLLRNACTYTDAGRVIVSIGADFVRIEDTGVGMNAEELGKIFTPYFRAGRSSRGGNGIGLTIVKRLSDRFGWKLDIQSQLGVGTIVTVQFPRPQPVDA
jgi:signal transduction histidine kinase